MKLATNTTRIISTFALLLLVTATTADTIVDFSNGAEGWAGPQGSGGSTTVEATGGNPAENMRTQFTDFGITFRNTSNPEFAQDLSQYGSVTISIDVKVESIGGLAGEITRPWLLDLRDLDVPGPYPWTSVWFKFGSIDSSQNGEWTTFTVTIDDPSELDLPTGWRGYGDETALGEPTLPAGVTFTDVLAGIDQVAFTTLEPGFFFTQDTYDVRIDNITITTTSGGCDGDLDDSGDVGFDDLVPLLSVWGPCPGCEADLDGDDDVGFDDLVGLLAVWGPC